MLEQLKAEKDGLTKTNKVKELALAIEDEIRKQAELDERIAQNPQRRWKTGQAPQGVRPYLTAYNPIHFRASVSALPPSLLPLTEALFYSGEIG